MPVGSVIWTHFDNMVLRQPTLRRVVGSATGSAYAREAEERTQLEFLARRLGELRSALASIRENWRPRRGAVQTARPASVGSQGFLGLAAATAATLTSEEEINATPTSFTPLGPDWTGTSSAPVTVDGVYDGDQDDDTLTFEVTQGGTIGIGEVRLQITDSGGNDVDDIRIRSNHAPGRVYRLNNDLEISFGAGSFTEGDTFTVDVSTSFSSRVDPDRAFDGTRNDDPLLEYGFTVTAGSFTINGEVIAVQADDTIRTVLDRINQSAAGVTATFDALTETISLVQDTAGAGPVIDLDSDTSGFLEAMKLERARLIDGTDAESAQPLEDVARFAAVDRGSILINGTAVDVDPRRDSLEDLLARITAAGVGVTASLDRTGQRVVLTADDPGASLELDDNGTGLAAALELQTGVHLPAGEQRGTGMAKVRAHGAAEAVRDAYQAINAIFGNDAHSGEAASFLTETRTALQQALEKAGRSDRMGLSAEFGLDADLEKTVGDLLPASHRLEQRLASLFRRRTGMADELLFGRADSSEKGLVNLLEDTLAAAMIRLEVTAGHRGVSLDRYA